MAIDLKKLETFRLVARFGSLSRAAVQLGLTVPAVSIQIKNLETDLGVSLFDHRPNRLKLTHHGSILLKDTNAILEAVERATETLTHPVRSYEGNILIAISADLARFAAPVISAFANKHPNLSITILARRTRESLSLVLSGEIDMAIGFFPRVPRGISKKALLDSDVTLLVPQFHPLARQRTPSLSQAFDFRVITRRLILDDMILPRKASIYLPNIIAVDTCQLAMDFVELQQGVGLVHGFCARADKRKKLRHIDMSHYFDRNPASLIMRSNAILGPAASALEKEITDSFTTA
jgi:DNA-binding transcriptional LysR family regulator